MTKPDWDAVRWNPWESENKREAAMLADLNTKENSKQRIIPSTSDNRKINRKLLAENLDPFCPCRCKSYHVFENVNITEDDYYTAHCLRLSEERKGEKRLFRI